MYNPEKFILSTDFATLKNDADTTVQVTFPGSQIIAGSVGPAGSYAERHVDVNIGAQGAISRIQISSSKDSNIIHPARNVFYTRNGTVLGFSATYTIDAFVYRISPTTMRCSLFVPNPYSDPLTTESGDETMTFEVNTFLPPFTT